MAKKIVPHLPWTAWVIVICILSFLPGNQLPQLDWNFISPDTLVHVAMYFILAFLLVFAFRKKNLNLIPVKVYLITALAGIAFGIFVELVQGNFIYKRYFDPADIVANSIGTVFGSILVAFVNKKLYKRRAGSVKKS